MKNKSTKNKIKLWTFLHKEDIVGFFKKFIPALLLFFLIIRIPSFTRNFFLSRLDSVTIGVIDNIEKRKGIKESEYGGKVIVKSYLLNYHFYVNEKKVEKAETIDRLNIKMKERLQLNKLENGDSIFIKYDSSNPFKCAIQLTVEINCRN